MNASNDDTAPNMQGFDSLPFDPEHYQHHVKDLDITEAEAHAFLSALWHIMNSMLDLGLRVDSVQLLPDFNTNKPMIASETDLHSNTRTKG